MDKRKFRKLGATVTALKLLVLATDTLNGVIINGGTVNGKVKSNESFTPSEGLALGSYIAPPLLFFLCAVIYYLVYTCLPCCKGDDDSNDDGDNKYCNGIWNFILSASLIVGGLLYYFGDNLLNLASGRDLGRSMDDLMTVMQILLIFALVIYRFIPLVLTKAELTSYKKSKGDTEDTNFSQTALDMVALALDCDAIFSVIEKTQCSCTMESDGTCSRVSEIICPTGDVYRLLWALYGILLLGYIFITIFRLILKFFETENPIWRDIIIASILVFLGLVSLAFLLVADNQLPLKCEYGDNLQELFEVRLGFMAISFVIYFLAFWCQVALHIYYHCSNEETSTYTQ